MYLQILLIPLLNGIVGLWIYDNIWLNVIELISVIFIIYDIYILDSLVYINLGNWFLNINYELRYDNISILMIILITIILNIVIIFSRYYVYNNNKLFIIYMYIFALYMKILVLSNNLYILFIGWEGVGLISYLLISFWWYNINNIKSGMKAIFYNKIGDISYILLICYNYNFNNISYIYILITSFSKSAQILFNGWLESAMAGPTPVSSLLHAATMVTAGYYLLLRYSIISINYSIISLLTIIISGIIAIIYNDIKVIIAYSTCSQIGYLIYSQLNNILSYNHLLVHGLFKALLFISSGYIIHKYNNIQDIRYYGYLIYNMIIEYIFIGISTLSLISFPFISAYYTKEVILLISFSNNLYILILSYIGTILTIWYSIRLLIITFFYKPNKLIIINYNHSYKYLFILYFLIIIYSQFIFTYYYDQENLIIQYILYFAIFIPIFNKFKVIKLYYIDKLINIFTYIIYKYNYIKYKWYEKTIFDNYI